MRSAILLFLPLALAGCGGSKEKQAAADARAQQAGFVPPSVMSRLDFGSSIERRFHALDRNGNNVIDATEMPRQDSRIVRLDRNGDGRITAEEWSEGQLSRFDRMDLNRDGSLTSDERGQYQTARQQP